MSAALPALPPYRSYPYRPIRQSPLANDALGVNVHFFRLGDGFPLVTERDLDMLQQAGFRRVRMDLLWREVEKQPGVFNFQKYDWAIQGLLKRGIRPMVIIGLGHPSYSPGLTIQPSWVQAGFERYAEETVKHFKGLNLIYELVNEPNHPEFWQPKPDAAEYMKLAKRLLPRLKSIDPNAFIAAPSTAGAPLPFLETCFRQGLLSLVDGVTIHPYQAFYELPPKNRIPEFVERDYQLTQALIQKYAPPGKQIPLIFGEWGYSSALNEISEQQQAIYMTRQALLGMMYGTPINIWYNWKGGIEGQSSDPTNKELNFELVHTNLVPKPAYYAIGQLTRRLSNKQYAGKEPSLPGDYILKFTNSQMSPSQTTYACWTIQPPHWINLMGRMILLTPKPCYQDF